MAHKKSLKALKRTLQDLRDNQNLFGSALILLDSDFRQKLLVVPRPNAAYEINGFEIFQFVETCEDTEAHNNIGSSDMFSKQFLDIGNGKISSAYIYIGTDAQLQFN